MKKIILFFLCISIFVSCQKQNSENVKTESSEKLDFKGFGELIIGTEFSSLKSYKHFKFSCENSYYADSYLISKEIGEVENVTILLKNGKIHDVSFGNSSISNKNKIDSCFRSYKSTVLVLPSSNKNWRAYNSNNKNIIFTITINPDDYFYHRLGYYPTNYFYYNSSDIDSNDYGI